MGLCRRRVACWSFQSSQKKPQPWGIANLPPARYSACKEGADAEGRFIELANGFPDDLSPLDSGRRGADSGGTSVRYLSREDRKQPCEPSTKKAIAQGRRFLRFQGGPSERAKARWYDHGYEFRWPPGQNRGSAGVPDGGTAPRREQYQPPWSSAAAEHAAIANNLWSSLAQRQSSGRDPVHARSAA